MLSANRADVYTDLNSLAKLKTEARKESPEALKETAKQFEAVFLNHVLKTMRETKLADGILDNDQSKFYGEMYDQQLASNLAGSVGLADLIVKQMKHEDPREEKTGKMNLEDYLNRSSTAGRAMPSRHGEVDGQAIGKADMNPTNSEPEPESKADELAASSNVQAQQSGSQADFIAAVDAKVRAEDGIQDSILKNSGNLPINSATDFVRHLHPIAEQAARELGVEPKVLLAQAALETNWGRSLIKNSDGESTFNLFNIKAGKAWQGDKAQARTLEYEHGVGRKMQARFRSYESFEESFQDYVRLIKSNPRYGDALKQAGSAEHYLRGLQQAGYATDPKYAEKVIQIYRGNTMNTIQPDLVVAMNDQA
ncbi:MAG: flagellar assembly peptidoglycan hydrolase FlgJ [Methylomicrobium sp.]